MWAWQLKTGMGAESRNKCVSNIKEFKTKSSLRMNKLILIKGTCTAVNCC